MKMFAHVIYTWLLAQLLHPVVFLVYSADYIDASFGTLLSLVLFSVLFSIPACAGCLLLFPLIVRSHFSIAMKLLLWCGLSLLMIQAGALLMSGLFSWEVYLEILDVTIPACVAALVVILCRYWYFAELVQRAIRDAAMIPDQNSL
jgi:hypothetical protein